MSTKHATSASFRELDYRDGDGIEVSLLWSCASRRLSVFVYDSRTLDCFEIPVEAARAREVFEHPFAFAPCA